ncbi:MAG: flagellar hook assembly protein FlgD [Pseudomonadota bacterium]
MVTATQDASNSAALIASLNASSSLSNNSGSATATQDQFLTMLTAQLRNQDPLNPMDNAQITSQMAQLSTVSGINQLNITLQALSNSMAMAQSVSASNMIGHGVLVPGSGINLASGQALGGVSLAQPADSLSVTIHDAAGNTVRTLQLGAQDSGVVSFAWDGKTDTGATAKDGSYSFTAQALLTGNKTAAATLAFGMVNAVTPGVQGATLNIGQLGEFALSDVQQIL